MWQPFISFPSGDNIVASEICQH